MPKPAALLAVLLLTLATRATATEPGSAQGTLTVGDTATPLTHAYAWEEADTPERLFEGSPQQRVVLLLLDRPLPPKVGADMMANS